MKIKSTFITFAGLLAGATSSMAATGFNNGRLYFITSFNGGSNIYNQVTSGTTPGAGAETGHNLSPDGVNPIFSSFGVLTLGNTLVVKGFEYRTYENNFSDVTHGNLFYRVFPTGSPSGGFTQITDSLNNDDLWTRTDGTANLLSGLTPGNYTIQIYTESYTNAVNSAGNIFGFTAGAGNPTATFTLVPEPSAALLGGLGLLGLLRRRRN
jgi:MYXO-CTERM domain-containing protein